MRFADWLKEHKPHLAEVFGILWTIALILHLCFVSLAAVFLGMSYAQDAAQPPARMSLWLAFAVLWWVAVECL